MSAVLDAALAYAARGWPVFPCNPMPKPADPALEDRSKAPLIREGYTAATTDPAIIRDWWSRWPDALIGLPVGEALGAFVVDLDPRKATCEELWQRLEEHIGASLGDPVGAVTQSGGWHLYFSMPAGEDAVGIRNRVGKKSGLVDNVDVRGTGGYVIAPPSVMRDGKSYAWRQRDDGTRGLTEAPPELIDAILRRGKFAKGDERKASTPPDAGDRARRYALAALDAELRELRNAPDGTRNDRLNAAAFALGQLVGAGALVESIVLAALEDVASAWPNIKKSRGTIRSGLTAGVAQPRELSEIDRPAALDAHPRAKDASLAGRPGPTVYSPSAMPWATPDLSVVDGEVRKAPTFPLPVLGDLWSRWAAARADAASAPVDYVAASLLASVGALLANVRWPTAGTGWSEPSHLWVALVGSPSSGKSPGMKAAVELVNLAEGELRVGLDEKLRAWRTREQSAKARRAVWEQEVAAAAREDRDPPPLPADAEPPEPFWAPRILIADATSEKQAELAAAMPRGLLLTRDELSGWLGAFDRYGGLGADRSFALEAWNGGSYVVDRKKAADPIRVRHLSVGALGGIQPDRLAPVIAGPDDGLPTRFLWAWPEKLPKFRIARIPVDDADARAAFVRLARLPIGTDGHGSPEPKRLRLSDDAVLLLEEFGQTMAAKAEDIMGPLAGALGKARGHALRLACILEHLAWCASPGAPEPEGIGGPAVRKAVDLMTDYFVPMAERVFGDAIIPPPDRGATRLARYLRSAGATEFNAREVRLRLGGSLRDAQAMDAACGELEEAGLILQRRPVGPRTRGRQAKVYDVHPALSRVRELAAVKA